MKTTTSSAALNSLHNVYVVYDVVTREIISRNHPFDEAVYLVGNSIRGGIDWCHKSRVRTHKLKARR